MDGRRVNRVIRVLPFDQAGPARLKPADGAGGGDPLAWAPHRLFTPSGRSALDAVLRSLALDPADEVLITNASGQMYISACVTCTVFNHCQPSRVLTNRTRAILAIHEYGYPHPRTIELSTIARARGIPLIEDCAHSLDSMWERAPLGSFGDFAIFSLSKVLPVKDGGILVGAESVPELSEELVPAGARAEAAYLEHLPALAGYSHRRRENCDAVRQQLPHARLMLDPGPDVTPFYVPVLTPDAPDIKQRSSAVEWGTTMREDLLLITTNPFVDAGTLVAALESAFPRREPG